MSEATPHRIVNPEGLLEPRGFAHAVVAEAGRTIWFSGQDAEGPGGEVEGETMAEQFAKALSNLARALAAAGAAPEHLVSMQVFVTDARAYRDALAALGSAWRDRLGKHYPAMALFEVNALFHPKAVVELVAVAVVPGG